MENKRVSELLLENDKERDLYKILKNLAEAICKIEDALSENKQGEDSNV